MPGHAAGGVEPLHQHLERHVLVVVGRQAAVAHLGEQLGDGGVAGHIDPQDEGVDEETHQVVQGRVGAPGDREPDGHIGAGAERGQQHRQGGLQNHEAGRVVLAGQPSDPLVELSRPGDGQGGAAVVGGRRVGPVGGQLLVLWHAG